MKKPSWAYEKLCWRLAARSQLHEAYSWLLQGRKSLAPSSWYAPGLCSWGLLVLIGGHSRPIWRGSLRTAIWGGFTAAQADLARPSPCSRSLRTAHEACDFLPRPLLVPSTRVCWCLTRLSRPIASPGCGLAATPGLGWGRRSPIKDRPRLCWQRPTRFGLASSGFWRKSGLLLLGKKISEVPLLEPPWKRKCPRSASGHRGTLY